MPLVFVSACDAVRDTHARDRGRSGHPAFYVLRT